MLKTTGARLQAVRKRLELTQLEMATLFGLKENGPISYMERRNTPVKSEYLDKLREKYDVNPSYIQMGEGPMFLKVDMAKEDSQQYGTPRIDLTEVGVRARFQLQAKDYQERNGIAYQKDVADAWHLDRSHFSAVMNDLKEITLPMLFKAHQHGHINLNYTASGEGGYYVGEGNAALLKRITELELVVDVLKENSSLKADTRKKHG